MRQTTCSSCGRRWLAASSRWCGHCGAALSPDAGSGPTVAAGSGRLRRPSGSGRREPLIVGALLAIAVAVATVVATAGGPEEVEAPPRAVELPPAEEIAGGREPPSTAEGPNAPPVRGPPGPLGCEPAGCLLWWTEHVDQRPAVVAGEILVHEGRDGPVGIDVRTGELLWHRDPPERHPGDDPAFAPTLVVADEDGWVSARGSHLWFRDVRTGEIEGEANLEDMRISHLERYGNGILVSGTAVGSWQRPRDERVVFMRSDGEVVWQRGVRRILDLRTEPPGGLLVDVDGDVALLGLPDGTERWRQEADEAHHFFVGSNLVRVTPGAGTGAVERLDPTDGTPLQRRGFTGELGVTVPIGGSLLHAVVDDEAHLIDANSLRIVEVRPAASLASGTPIATHTRKGTAVLWPGGEGAAPELAVYRRGADVPVRVALDRHPEVPQVGRNEIHDLGDGVVRVVLAGAQVIDIDIDAAEAIRTLGPSGGWYPEQGLLAALRGTQGDSLQLRGALVLVHADDEPRLIGERGEIHLTGASRIASTDPLIVHGGAGAMRLDRDLLVP